MKFKVGDIIYYKHWVSLYTIIKITGNYYYLAQGFQSTMLWTNSTHLLYGTILNEF